MSNGLEREFPDVAWQAVPPIGPRGMPLEVVRCYVARGRKLRSRAIRDSVRSGVGAIARALLAMIMVCRRSGGAPAQTSVEGDSGRAPRTALDRALPLIFSGLAIRAVEIGAAMMLEHLRRMARYNAWANRRLYEVCAQLAEDEYRKPRPAFFGSIHGTLNHLLIGDRIWLARIEGQGSPPVRLDDQPCASLAELQEARAVEDARMIRLVDGYAEDDLEKPVRYRLITRPEETETPLHVCWLHLFNHQTHHRGQVHDQLSQTEVAPPPLDLIFYLRRTGDPR